MNIADRILSLRKSKGMSQEELADKIGVSRQTISKWESEQSTPDIDKVILLSDFFDVTTDYLLKGIEPKKEEKIQKRKIDSRIFSSIGTFLNFTGLVVAIAIWIEKQVAASVAIGMVLLAIGCMLHFMGQFMDEQKETSCTWFWLINVWLIVLMPLSCIFNIVQGLLGGFSWMVSPIPQLGNSLSLYTFAWFVYILICGSVDGIILFKNKREGSAPVNSSTFFGK